MPSNRPVRPTIREPRSTAAVLLVLTALIAGCAPAPTPTASPTSSPALAASPTATPTGVATPLPTPNPPALSPSATPSSAPSPITLPGFTTAIPPAAGTAWSGISWHKLKTGDPFAKVRTMVRWRGGFVAVGGVIPTGDTARSPVWVSTDGAHWRPLDPQVLGPATVVLGVVVTKTGLVALTLQGGTNQCGDQNASVGCWALAAPLQTWTSTDGSTWTSHPGPDIALPTSCEGCGLETPIFRAGTPGLLVVNRYGAAGQGGPVVALSPDGITWKAVPASAFPAHFQFADIAPFGSGFIAVGDSGGSQLRAMALMSSDGRHWVAHYLPNLTSDRLLGTVADEIVVGPTGVIVTGGFAGAGSPPIWWTSTSGRAWLRFLGFPPLGVAQGGDTCEAGCGGWPNGVLLGDGVRMLAYRGGTKVVAWGSSDGRTWRKIVIGRTRPSSARGPIEDMILLPIGLLWIGADGSVWFGRPTT
jgi:hypothetical protein